MAAAAHDITPSLVDLDTALSYEGLQAAGTGIVFGRGGLVLTNNHVIEGETSLTAVDVATGRRYRGVVVGYDMASDVAVVRLVGAPGLPVARFAPGSAHLGQQVVAVGNAGGRGGTPTAAGGTVTGLDRSITASDQGGGTVEQLSGLISTNADVQLGDSGGSLVDAAGQVLGVDTATLRGVAFSGTGHEGFAIPIDTAMGIARRILAGRGSAAVHVGPTAFIGVRASASSCSAGAPGTSVSQGSGALVCDVIPDTGASAAGLVPGDLITALSGFPVRTPASLTHLLVERFHPGETVTVSFRGADGRGAGRGAAVTLGSGPPA
ncbi:PDZ domain-containing protein [Acidimicrobiaceae bacterium USS-CC1]|uniref:PDZ domain-containing protein n=1 Tax=Acidiferrimicrobium australe TaxID=2664430 RepID=A0ABW9QNQ4_9ACTN|nr:PDZ domain-containing protein [Acidiferrimicrobium australe]